MSILAVEKYERGKSINRGAMIANLLHLLHAGEARVNAPRLR